MTRLKKFLLLHGACRQALRWVGKKPLSAAWKTCKRGSWMSWLLYEMEGKRGWPRNASRLETRAWDHAYNVMPRPAGGFTVTEARKFQQTIADWYRAQVKPGRI